MKRITQTLSSVPPLAPVAASQARSQGRLVPYAAVASSSCCPVTSLNLSPQQMQREQSCPWGSQSNRRLQEPVVVLGCSVLWLSPPVARPGSGFAEVCVMASLIPWNACWEISSVCWDVKSSSARSFGEIAGKISVWIMRVCVAP